MRWDAVAWGASMFRSVEGNRRSYYRWAGDRREQEGRICLRPHALDMVNWPREYGECGKQVGRQPGTFCGLLFLLARTLCGGHDQGWFSPAFASRRGAGLGVKYLSRQTAMRWMIGSGGMRGLISMLLQCVSQERSRLDPIRNART